MRFAALFALTICSVATTFTSRASAQYSTPYSDQEPRNSLPDYVDSMPDWQIEKYLSKWKVTGVRPSREAFIVVRHYGVHARSLINAFGDDALAALLKVSGTSAISLNHMRSTLKQVKQVSALLRLIATHEEPDRIVQVLVAYKENLVDSPFVEVLLQKPDAVLALGPMAQMDDVVALFEDPAANQAVGETMVSVLQGAKVPSINVEGWTKDQMVTVLLGGFAAGVVVLVLIQIRRKMLESSLSKRVVAQPVPRITYNNGRPTPAFMQRRGSQSN